MTKIYLGKKESIKQITISGHSGYDKRGADIVCAGISALSQAFVKLAAELEKRGIADIKSLTIKDGYLDIVVDDKRDMLAFPYIMLTMGLEEICDQYPQYAFLSGGEIKI